MFFICTQMMREQMVLLPSHMEAYLMFPCKLCVIFFAVVCNACGGNF